MEMKNELTHYLTLPTVNHFIKLVQCLQSNLNSFFYLEINIYSSCRLLNLGQSVTDPKGFTSFPTKPSFHRAILMSPLLFSQKLPTPLPSPIASPTAKVTMKQDRVPRLFPSSIQIHFFLNCFC